MTVTLAQISSFRRMVVATVSLREAHRRIKIWRVLWRVSAALKYCQRDADPSLGVRNVETQPRQAVWTDGEVARLARALGRRAIRAYPPLCRCLGHEPVAGRCAQPDAP